jgi:hypothetical protein
VKKILGSEQVDDIQIGFVELQYKDGTSISIYSRNKGSFLEYELEEN